MTIRPLNFDAFIGPIFDKSLDQYELAVFLTNNAASLLTMEALTRLRDRSAEKLRVHNTSRLSKVRQFVCTMSIRGYTCKRDEVLKESWLLALVVNECLNINVDIIWDDLTVLPPGSLIDIRC